MDPYTADRPSVHSPEPVFKQPAMAPRPKGWLITLILHILSVLLAFIYVVIAGTLNSEYYTPFFPWALVGIASNGLAFVFSSSELIARGTRSNHRGWKPLVHLICSPLLGIASIVIVGMLIWVYVYESDRGPIFQDYCENRSSTIYCFDRSMQARYLILIIFSFFQLVLHLVNAVMALVMRRDAKRIGGEGAAVLSATGGV